MGTIPFSHALPLSFLVLALAISSLTTTAISHSLPYSTAPSQPPSLAPNPSHHHSRHYLSPSPAPSPTYHHHHHHSRHYLSPSPAPSPTYHHSEPSTSPPVTHPMPPSQPPVKSPTKAPAPYIKPPSQPPVKGPTKAPAPVPYSKPPRKLVAVQGVVYCKNCSYVGVDTLFGSSPLSGATVELRCRNTRYMIKKTSNTDKNGYFFLQAPKYITTYGAHKCRVFLTNMPKNGGPCSHATNLNGGVSGAFLFLDKNKAPPTKPLPYTIFTVGPFAYEPPKCYKH